MLNRTTLLAFGLGSLLTLGTATTAFAAPAEYGHHLREGAPVALKVHHRHRADNRYPRRWKEHRRHQRQEIRHWRDHRRDYRHRAHRHFDGGEFAGGLLFGGILGYVIGSDY
jgi:hypothetical protein